MYESFFGMTQRPFTTTPTVQCVMRTEQLDEIHSRLVDALTAGDGVQVVTGPAGVGKTLTSMLIASDLEPEFTVASIDSPGFQDASALLQAILYELGQPYLRMGEQELRLELKTVTRTRLTEGRPVVIVVDDAHTLGFTALSELSYLAQLIEEGQPLVRLLLTGQIELEEQLAQPHLQSFNQRIRNLFALEPLSKAESRSYLDFRLNRAGSGLEKTLTDEAVELVCRASEGLPRNLNQLADHSLLLAYIADTNPVTLSIVQEALTDLKQLPLHWNAPTLIPDPEPVSDIRHDRIEVLTDDEDESSSVGVSTGEESGTPAVSLPSALSPFEGELHVIEVGAELPEASVSEQMPDATDPRPDEIPTVPEESSEPESLPMGLRLVEPDPEGEDLEDETDESVEAAPSERLEREDPAPQGQRSGQTDNDIEHLTVPERDWPTGVPEDEESPIGPPSEVVAGAVPAVLEGASDDEHQMPPEETDAVLPNGEASSQSEDEELPVEESGSATVSSGSSKEPVCEDLPDAERGESGTDDPSNAVDDEPEPEPIRGDLLDELESLAEDDADPVMESEPAAEQLPADEIGEEEITAEERSEPVPESEPDAEDDLLDPLDESLLNDTIDFDAIDEWDPEPDGAFQENAGSVESFLENEGISPEDRERLLETFNDLDLSAGSIGEGTRSDNDSSAPLDAQDLLSSLLPSITPESAADSESWSEDESEPEPTSQEERLLELVQNTQEMIDSAKRSGNESSAPDGGDRSFGDDRDPEAATRNDSRTDAAPTLGSPIPPPKRKRFDRLFSTLRRRHYES